MSSAFMTPKLNGQILNEIVERIGEIDKREENSCISKRFMLSGRESFNAALNYFSKADRINFRDLNLDICVKKNKHLFENNWKFLDSVLDASVSSITHLCIYDSPKNLSYYERYGTSEDGYKILDKFCANGNGLKHLTLSCNLPQRYINFFQYECNFETVTSEHHYDFRGKLTDSLLIPSNSLRITIRDLDQFFNGIYNGASFCFVKELYIDMVDCPVTNLSPEYAEHFSYLITNCLPYLEILKVQFLFHYRLSLPVSEFNVYVNTLLMEKIIPEKIWAEISLKFRFSFSNASLPSINYNDTVLTKSIAIRHNLIVKLEAKFPAKMFQGAMNANNEDADELEDSTVSSDDDSESEDSTASSDSDSESEDSTASSDSDSESEDVTASTGSDDESESEDSTASSDSEDTDESEDVTAFSDSDADSETFAVDSLIDDAYINGSIFSNSSGDKSNVPSNITPAADADSDSD